MIFCLFVLDLKEIRSAFDVFSICSEEKNEESAHESRSTDEFRLKDKQVHSRTSRDETDTWAYIAAEGDHDITEDSSGKLTMCH